MDKDALILIISIIAVGWVLAQISSAAGRKSRQKASEQKAPKAESIRTIFQYMDETILTCKEKRILWEKER